MLTIRRFKTRGNEIFFSLVVLTCFFLLIVVILQLSKIQNLSLFVVTNSLPLFLLCLLLLYESGVVNNKSKLFFDIFENGVIYIPAFSLYFSIFKSSSITLGNNNNGLDRLTDLGIFSLEIDNETKSLRVLIFSKYRKNHINRIKQSLPLLEAIFPDITLMTSNESKSFLSSYSQAVVAGYSLIQCKERFMIPVQNHSRTNQFEVSSKIIFAYNPYQRESKLRENDKTSQIYTLSRFNGPIDFNFIANLLLKKNWRLKLSNDSEKELLRGIIRFQLNDLNLISSQEGLSIIQKIMSNPRISIQPLTNDDTDQNETVFKKPDIESEISKLNVKCGKNPICKELCNINKNPELEELNKSRLCNKRISFCTKLLRNENFVSLLMELMQKDDKEKKGEILNKLLVHLSFHQVYCLIAQFIFISERDDLDVVSIQLLHFLFTNIVINEFYEDRPHVKTPNAVQKGHNTIYHS